ncbi:hypothetical protein [Sphingomonas xinjiangensis]|uniref:Uncharacterized protein n=1 Tax=Sphingomonas xinjiangensis TaxID=643568 RepID=A0A840YA43_9SPHN|nr:hypothetical protein [Sphingomonas xinjiangensis]MBB5709714.1 hypothetical protein [Sphingomonas xinjiangensis]
MLNPIIVASGLLLLFAPSAQPMGSPWDMAAHALQQRATVHVPRVTVTTTTIILREPRPTPLLEKKAGKCVKVEKLAGFTVNRFDSVDLLLKDGGQLRARLGARCPALGFYSGFYVKPNPDKKICAGRDAFRSRTGRSCGIQSFAKLVASD